MIYQYSYTEYPKLNDFGYDNYLWRMNYWDGPISGVGTYKDKTVWFEQCAEYEWTAEDKLKSRLDEEWDPPWYRRYVVLDLTMLQILRLRFDHMLFRMLVGHHTDYKNNSGTKPRGTKPRGTKPQWMWKFFYKYRSVFKHELNILDNKVLGWFEV